MLNRRQTLAALAALCLMPPRGGATPPQRVIVIGAGIAGLGAARMLADAGLAVTVLESRARIGGRIWTSSAWPDLPVDLGASWIHGVEGNPVTALADAAGARRACTSYDASMLLGPDGRKLDIDSAYARAEQLFEAARAELEETTTDLSLAAAIEGSGTWQRSPARQHRLLRHYVNSMIEQEYAGDWREVSARHFDLDEVFPGDDELFPDGFSPVIEPLARGLDIRTGQRVTAVELIAAGVRVSLHSGERLLADRAIVTVPLGTLRAGDIRFSPALAPARQKAIDTLGMGLLNKCWLRFDRVLWSPKVDWIEWLGPRDGYWCQWLSLTRATQQPVLQAFNAGAQAKDLESLDDEATVASAHDALRSMFGNRFPAPRAAQVTRWSRDEHAWGSYSFNAVGTTPATRAALAGADWDGALQFAGEACSSEYFGTTHGALLSGRDCAARLLKSA